MRFTNQIKILATTLFITASFTLAAQTNSQQYKENELNQDTTIVADTTQVQDSVKINFALKNNIIYDAFLTPNISFEVALAEHWTLDTQMGANFFFYTTDAQSSNYKTKKWSHWLIQPEIRYWKKENFNGWYFGAHVHGGMMNVGEIDAHHFILKKAAKHMKDRRYEGYFYGLGVGAGYQWRIGKHFNIEAALGLGWAHFEYDRFKCSRCGTKEGKGGADYLGPTKAAISVAYVF